MPWRLEGVEPTFPGTWEWLVLPDMGGTFDKVKERLLAGSSLFLFSILVSIPTISFHSKRPETTAKCILSSSFFTQAMPWRLEGVEPTFPGTWEWLVLPDMGGTFDKVKERLLAGSSLFLFSIVVSIPTCHVGDRGSIPTISQKRRTSSTLGRQPITPEPKHLHI